MDQLKRHALKKHRMYPEDEAVSNLFEINPQTEIDSEDDDSDLPDEDDEAFQINE